MTGPLSLSRRQTVTALTAMLMLAPLPAGAQARPGESFSWSRLQRMAQAGARKPWTPVELRSHAHHIDYDAVGQIAYREDKTLWNDPATNTALRFFPLSRFAATPVEINLVENGRSVPFPYDVTLFESGSRDLAALLAESDGFAGFRAMNPGGVGDWLAFQGASYFRSAGPLDQYGLSARGIAVNTSVPGASEEFPTFTRFWLERGEDGALIVYAYLDGPSLTGAFRFVNRKGADAVTQDVSVSLYPRKDIEQLGLAPLTSMFWYGEGNRKAAVDWRPEIHDSDGLAILTGNGERIWRPLTNPGRTATNSFSDRAPNGFGLLQRDRDHDNYLDDGVFYEKRPSLWVEPQGDWGAGSVVLYEIPTEKEYEDNIVAFWQPAAPIRAGRRVDFNYRLSWIGDEPQPISVARNIGLWKGVAGRPAHDPVPGARKVVLDFDGPQLKPYTEIGSAEAVIDVTNGRVLSSFAHPVQGTPGRWRLAIDLAPETTEPTDLRVFLRANGNALTETVIYQLHWTD